jgi:transketolase
MHRKEVVVATEREKLAKNLTAHGIELIRGLASFEDSATVSVKTSRGENLTLHADAVLIATGSEVQLAVEAQKLLADKDIVARVVSMPCVEWFESQPYEYRDSVLPPSVSARVAVEAGIAQCWHKLVGDTGEIVSIEHYGASADAKTLFHEYGFTPEAVVDAAERTLDN